MRSAAPRDATKESVLLFLSVPLNCGSKRSYDLPYPIPGFYQEYGRRVDSCPLRIIKML
jgi:hypothetical protein